MKLKNKIKALFFVLFSALFIMGTFAETTESTNRSVEMPSDATKVEEVLNASLEINETEIERLIPPKEAEIMSINWGKEVRKIMLLRDIERILIQANTINDRLEDGNLSNYIIELEELKDEVNNLEIDENFTENFVAYKKEILDLFKEIRTYIQGLNLSEDLKQEIRNQIRERTQNSTTLNQLREQIREKVKYYNEYRLNELGKTLGLKLGQKLNASALVNKTRLGQELKEILKNELKNRERIKEMKEKMHELKMKREVLRKQMKEKVSQRIQQVLRMRFERKLEWMKNNHPQAYKNIVENIKERMKRKVLPIDRSQIMQNRPSGRAR